MDDKEIMYIFNDIKIGAVSKADLYKVYMAQKKIKRSLTLTIIFTAFYIASMKLNIANHELKIEKLNKEIEALKSEKGE